VSLNTDIRRLHNKQTIQVRLFGEKFFLDMLTVVLSAVWKLKNDGYLNLAVTGV